MNNFVAIIGLGYVGLPLCIKLAENYRAIGFDNNTEKVALLKKGKDYTKELAMEALSKTTATFTHNQADLQKANIYIITVATPINNDKTPDLRPLKQASKTVATYLKPNDLVIYESTVYPGTTEEVCLPILEKISGLSLNTDFSLAYCPERINPGDKKHTVANINRVISASNPYALSKIKQLYTHVTSGILHEAPSIKVAEASKVIENAQRDVNIAFINELAIAFHYMGIDTKQVLDAANTKWNFLNFRPGLVGGHCISIDPYYFIYKAEQLGYHSHLLSSARLINQQMANYVTQEVIKHTLKSNNQMPLTKIGVLGVTFKEDCADIRNSKVIDIIRELETYNINVIAHDPLADPQLVHKEYGLILTDLDAFTDLDAVIVAVGHKRYVKHLDGSQLKRMLKEDRSLVFDLKSLYNITELNQHGLTVWRI